MLLVVGVESVVATTYEVLCRVTTNRRCCLTNFESVSAGPYAGGGFGGSDEPPPPPNNINTAHRGRFQVNVNPIGDSK